MSFYNGTKAAGNGQGKDEANRARDSAGKERASGHTEGNNDDDDDDDDDDDHHHHHIDDGLKKCKG